MSLIPVLDFSIDLIRLGENNYKNKFWRISN